MPAQLSVMFAVLWWTRQPGKLDPVPHVAGVFSTKTLAEAAAECVDIGGSRIGTCLVRWTPVDGFGMFDGRCTTIKSTSQEEILRHLAAFVAPVAIDVAYLCCICHESGITGTWTNSAIEAGIVPADWSQTLYRICSAGIQPSEPCSIFFPVFAADPVTQLGRVFLNDRL